LIEKEREFLPELKTLFTAPAAANVGLFSGDGLLDQGFFERVQN